jgi:glucose-1-phosphatase
MKGVIFFDIANVLVKYSIEKMFKQISTMAGINIEKLKSFFIDDRYYVKYEIGQIDEKKLYRDLCLLANKKLPYDALMKAGSDVFQEDKEMFKLVSKLKNEGHKLILLSNTCFVHFHYKLKFLPIIKLFDDKILSFEKNLRKPDPKIFQEALKMTKGHPSFYTDDILEYVQVAKNQGLDGEVFQSRQNLYLKLKEKKFIN